jgi:hypothetical protein
MASRIYLPSSGSAPVTPSSWNHANQAGTTYTLPGQLSKGSTALTSRTTATGTTNPYTRAVMRYVIGPLRAAEISGTVNAVLRCSESNGSANATMSLAVKIITAAGADRAVLLAATASDSAASPREFTTTLGSRRAFDASETRPIALSAQTPQDGDYLVIEIGFRSATGTTYNVVLQHGDAPTTDLDDTDGDTGADAPWVEFSQDLPWVLPTVTTQDASAVTAGTATGNGNITAVGFGSACDARGLVYSTTSHADPGSVAPGASAYESNAQETGGSFGTGAFTEALSSLPPVTLQYARAWAHGPGGYRYGDEVSFTTLNWPIRLKASSYIPAGGATATTEQLTTDGTFQAGTISDDTNPVASQDIDTDRKTEHEVCVEMTDASSVGDAYRIRLTDGGAALLYTATPQWTRAAGSGTVEVSGSDTLGLAVGESQPIAASVAPTDTVNVAVGESAAPAATVQASDAVGASIAESASVGGSLSGSDTAPVSVAEQVPTIPVALSTSDAIAVALAEAAAILGTLAVSDQVGAAVGETAGQAVVITVTDQAALAVAEGAPAIAVTLTRVETLDVSLGDVAALFVTLTATDTAALAVAEDGGLFATKVVTDVLDVALGEGTPTVAIALPASDTLAVAVAESTSLQVTLSTGDAVAAALAEAAALFVPRTGTDQAAVVVAEGAALASAVTAADAIGLAVAEGTPAIAISLQVLDVAQFALLEDVGLVVSLTHTDGAAVSVQEASTALLALLEADAIDLSLLEDAVVVTSNGPPWVVANLSRFGATRNAGGELRRTRGGEITVRPPAGTLRKKGTPS